MFAVSLDVSFGESKVENENFIRSFVETDTEVVRFDVSVNEVTVVDVFDSGDHLVDEHEN